MLLNHSQILTTVSGADVQTHDLPHVFWLSDEAHLIRDKISNADVFTYWVDNLRLIV